MILVVSCAHWILRFARRLGNLHVSHALLVEQGETKMSFEEGFDLTQEPKNVFVSFLIYNMKQIEFQIFFSSHSSSAIRSLRGLIGSLSKEAQKKLKKEYDKLREWDQTGRCTRLDLENVYNTVCAFLHTTYLAEVSRGIIPASTLPSEGPRPKAKKYKKTLPDGVP